MTSPTPHVTLPKLFAGHLFRVPQYQRGYAWTARQLQDLWTDLELLDEDTRHFTGMIVVKPRGEHTDDETLEQYRVLEVIDGQQRLTTLVILIQALLEGVEERIRERLRPAYIGRPGVFRLALNPDSQHYFEHLLTTGAPRDQTENGSQQNLLRAHRFFSARVAELDADGRRARLTRLQSSLRFVLHVVDDDAEAGLIFEVMNNRGKPLSEADRLKNYLMFVAHKMGMSRDAVEGIARSWGDVFKQVMRASPTGQGSTDAEDRLLRNHWILYREARFPKEYRGMSISQRIRQDLQLAKTSDPDRSEHNTWLKKQALAYVSSLVDTAHDYAEIMNPAAPGVLAWAGRHEAELRLVLLSFHRMGQVATALPVLLAARRRLGRDPELFLELARALSTYAFRVFVVCNVRSHTGANHFRRVARRLFAVADGDLESYARHVVADVSAWTDWHADDDEVVGWLTASNFYEAHRAHEIRYLFYEVERSLASGPTTSIDWATFSNGKLTQVEHIWARGEQWLGDRKRRHEKNVSRLGNLTISHFNQTLGKRSFRDKRKIYKNSSIQIENRLARHRTWGLNHIDRREKELVAFVLKRWPIADYDEE